MPPQTVAFPRPTPRKPSQLTPTWGVAVAALITSALLFCVVRVVVDGAARFVQAEKEAEQPSLAFVVTEEDAERAEAEQTAKNAAHEAFLASGTQEWWALDGLTLSAPKANLDRKITLTKPYTGGVAIETVGSAGTRATIETQSTAGGWVKVAEAVQPGTVQGTVVGTRQLRVTLAIVEMASPEQHVQVVAIRPLPPNK